MAGVTLTLSLSPRRGSSAVCVYSFGDIDGVFRTSRLKGYSGPTPEVKPGQVRQGEGQGAGNEGRLEKVTSLVAPDTVTAVTTLPGQRWHRTFGRPQSILSL